VFWRVVSSEGGLTLSARAHATRVLWEASGSGGAAKRGVGSRASTRHCPGWWSRRLGMNFLTRARYTQGSSKGVKCWNSEKLLAISVQSAGRGTLEERAVRSFRANPSLPSRALASDSSLAVRPFLKGRTRNERVRTDPNG